MNNFKGSGFKKGGPKFSGKNKFSGGRKPGRGQGRDQYSRNTPGEMFGATCSECRKPCDVPFKPAHDKPVYCSDCFGAKKSANEPRGDYGDRGRFERGSYGDRGDRPQRTKPPRDQRSPRHDPTRGRGTDAIAELTLQVAGIDAKLNRILDLINPPMPSPKATAPVKESVVADVAAKEDAQPAPKVAEKKVAKKASKKTAVKKVAKATVKKVTPKKVAAKKVVKKVVAKKGKK